MAVANTPDNQAKCVCPNCPSYNLCMGEKSEMLFCSTGRATCEFEKKGCICGTCPVKMENHLSSGYYCATGAEV